MPLIVRESALRWIPVEGASVFKTIATERRYGELAGSDGVPTRLLDWSYSAYIALYFAVEQTGNEDHAALWALRTAALVDRSRTITKDRFGFPWGANFENPDRLSKIAFPPAFVEDAFGLVVPLLPSFHVSRLSSQQGCFLLNCNYFRSFEDSLAAMMAEDTASWLVRITFPKTLREECLKRLMHFNIHPASLYPDLDGLAKFLALKNELFPINCD